MNRFVCIVVLLLSAAPALADTCAQTQPGTSQWFSDTWGIGFDGKRYQPATRTSIDASNASRLELKWVYGLASPAPRSFPLVTEDTIFFGEDGRGLVALDRETGCTRWENTEFDDIGTGIVHENVDGRDVLFFSGRMSGVYAVDAASGALIWHSTVSDHPIPMYSGTPIAHGGRVFVPLSSMEVALSMNPLYGCCTTSGGMAAFASDDGRQLWSLPTILDEPQITGRRYFFVEEWGPSGAPVWNSPMLDVERGLLFYGSGQNYSRPASLTSDAIFAVDVETGEPRWIQQYTDGDAWNLSCGVPGHPNCPNPMGPDLDFGAPPLLVTASDGRDLVLAGQKSGDIYAIRPENGDTIWSRRFGRGGALGGVHWGMAANPELGLLFVPISDRPAMPGSRDPAPGLYAVDYDDGELVWSAPRESDCTDCWPGLSAAITAGPDIVVAGGLDGRLEIYAAATGDIIWTHDSVRDYETVNGVPARGGGFDAHGPMLADDLLIVASGYGSFGQLGGNALLVFEVRDE